MLVLWPGQYSLLQSEAYHSNYDKCVSTATDCISLRDLKACKLTPAFLNTFINVEKYLEYEQRDPVTTARDDSEGGCSEWDRYAAEQYEILLAEEAGENEIR